MEHDVPSCTDRTRLRKRPPQRLRANCDRVRFIRCEPAAAGEIGQSCRGDDDRADDNVLKAGRAAPKAVQPVLITPSWRRRSACHNGSLASAETCGLPITNGGDDLQLHADTRRRIAAGQKPTGNASDADEQARERVDGDFTSGTFLAETCMASFEPMANT